MRPLESSSPRTSQPRTSRSSAEHWGHSAAREELTYGGLQRPTLKTMLAVTITLCFVGAIFDSIVLDRPLTAELVAPLMTIVLLAYIRNGNGHDK